MQAVELWVATTYALSGLPDVEGPEVAAAAVGKLGLAEAKLATLAFLVPGAAPGMDMVEFCTEAERRKCRISLNAHRPLWTYESALWTSRCESMTLG